MTQEQKELSKNINSIAYQQVKNNFSNEDGRKLIEYYDYYITLNQKTVSTDEVKLYNRISNVNNTSEVLNYFEKMLSNKIVNKKTANRFIKYCVI